MRKYKIPILLGTSLLTASLVFAFASTAFAASAGAASASRVALRSPQLTGSNTAEARSLQQIRIVCHASVSLPFVAGNDMEAIGSIYCSANVSGLLVTTFLYRDGRLIAKAISINAGRNYEVNRVTYKCTYPYHYHNWQALMAGIVYFPPGYEPPSGKVGSVSGIVNLLC